MDELLSQIPNPDAVQVEPRNLELHNGDTCGGAIFPSFMGDDEVKAIQGSAVPTNSQKSTTWAVKVWRDWSANCRQVSQSNWPLHLYICSEWELN